MSPCPHMHILVMLGSTSPRLSISRSGHSSGCLSQPACISPSKQGLTLANAPGLIDSRYRGEVMIAAINLDPHSAVHVSRGSRIAQLVIIATPAMEVVEVEELDDTERGERGFGSSGVARGDG